MKKKLDEEELDILLHHQNDQLKMKEKCLRKLTMMFCL